MTREQVLIEFAMRQSRAGWTVDAQHWQVNAMADEIVRLRSILAALREPSDIVCGVAYSAWQVAETRGWRAAIRAAVAEAEADASHGARATQEVGS